MVGWSYFLLLQYICSEFELDIFCVKPLLVHANVVYADTGIIIIVEERRDGAIIMLGN